MRCNNGGCTKPVYRGKECYRCWAGTKWDSMKQRVENRRGQYPQWAGKKLECGRRDFIAWAYANPPPAEMRQPSIDRIDASIGYSIANIRWLEARQNSRNRAHDIPLTHRRCTRCGEIKELNSDNFHRNGRDHLGFQFHCRACRKLHAASQRVAALVCA